MTLQIRSPASQIKTLQMAHTAATTAHNPIVSNGHVFVPTSYADANAINGFCYEAEISDAPKVAGTAFAIGDKLYWDATAGNLTKTTTSNTLVGYATAPALSADVVCSLAFNAFAA